VDVGHGGELWMTKVVKLSEAELSRIYRIYRIRWVRGLMVTEMDVIGI
jgi:hypothetical protein